MANPSDQLMLTRTLDAALAHQARVARWTRWIAGVTGWLALVLAIMVIDALVRWGQAGQWIASGLCVVSALAVVYYATRAGRGAGASSTARDLRQLPQSSQQSSLHTAVALENHHGLSDNPLVNALWLDPADSHTHTADASLHAALRERVQARAAELAQQVNPEAVADVTGRMRRCGELAGVLLIWLVMLAVLWRLPARELPRLLLPWQDRPAFSLTRFQVRLPAQALPNPADYTLSIHLAGLLPQRLEMVTLDERGRPVDMRTAEQLAPNHYQLTLSDLRQPVKFYLDSDTGRSEMFTVMVNPLEPVQTRAPADRADRPDDATSAVSTSQPLGTAGADQPLADTGKLKEQPEIRAAASGQRALIEALSDLLAKAQKALAEHAADSAESQAVADARDVQTQARQLSHQVRDLQAQAKSALERTGTDALPADARAVLDQLARTLGGLKIQHLPPLGDTAAGVRSWLEQVIRDGKADLAALAARQNNPGSHPGRSDAESGRLTQGDHQEASATSDQHSQLRRGVYQQTRAQNQSQETPSTAAQNRQSPPEYRAMVQQYFDRINQDQTPGIIPPVSGPPGVKPAGPAVE